MEKEHKSKSKKIFDTAATKIPAVASQPENDETEMQTSLINDSTTQKSRRKQNIVLRNDF